MYAIAVTTTNDDISQITGYGSYFNTLDVERFMFYTDRPLYVLLIEKETEKFAHVRTFTNKHLIDNRKYYYYGLDHLRLRSTIPHIGNFPSQINYSQVSRDSNIHWTIIGDDNKPVSQQLREDYNRLR